MGPDTSEVVALPRGSEVARGSATGDGWKKAAAIGIALALLYWFFVRGRKGGRMKTGAGQLEITITGAQCRIVSPSGVTEGPCSGVTFDPAPAGGVVTVDGTYGRHSAVQSIIDGAQAAGWKVRVNRD